MSEIQIEDLFCPFCGELCYSHNGSDSHIISCRNCIAEFWFKIKNKSLYLINLKSKYHSEEPYKYCWFSINFINYTTTLFKAIDKLVVLSKIDDITPENLENKLSYYLTYK